VVSGDKPTLPDKIRNHTSTSGRWGGEKPELPHWVTKEKESSRWGGGGVKSESSNKTHRKKEKAI